jgi:uncharacterized protein
MDTRVELRPRQQWVIGYAAWIFRFRWLVIAISVVVVAAFGYGATYLRINPDSRLFFSPDSPELKALENLENTYSKTNSVVIILLPRSGNVFTRDTLSAVAEATTKALQIPYAVRADSITNYKYSSGKGDDFIVNDLVPDPESLTDADLQAIRDKALGDALLVNQMVSAKGDVAAVHVQVIRTDSNLASVEKIARSAREIAQDIRARHPNIEVRLSGGVLADVAFAEAARADSNFLTPLMVVLVVLTLWLGLRSVYSMIATMAVVIMSMIVAVGWAGWAGLIMNSITVGAPIMSMTLAIADCVHVLAGAGQLQRKGHDQRSAIVESLRLNWTPILMTTVTTVVAFLAVNFADSPPINDVGNIVAVGVTAAWVLCVTFFPALLIVLPAPKRLPVLSDPRFLTFMSRKIISWRTPILVGSAIVVCFLAIGIGRMKFDDDIIKYFSKDFEFRKDTEVLQNRLTGLHRLVYSVPAKEEGGVIDPKYLNTLDEFGNWLRKQEHVTYVSTIAEIIKRLNRDMHDGNPDFFRIPASRELAAQYLLLYEMSLPAGHDLNDHIDIAKSSSVVGVKLANVTSEQIRELARRGEEWLAQNGYPAPATGLSVMYSHMTRNNIKSMVLGTVVELIVISFLMIFMLRNVKIGLISLVPNLLPAAMAFGLWGWMGFEVNLAISAVAAITFGIIVDDTIHSLTKYMRARRDLRMDPPAAVEYTYIHAGDPMLLTGATLILGFGVLAFSGFAVTHQLGLLSASIIALAIVADLVLLPPLLLLIDRPWWKSAPSRRV